MGCMELEFKEDSKSTLVVEITGEDHTLMHVLTTKVQEEKGVKNAAYRIDHPLKKIVTLHIETDGKVAPKAALKSAIDAVAKDSAAFKKALSAIKV